MRAACEPILVCDQDLLARHARPMRLDAGKIDVLACPQPETAALGFGVVSPVSGRASIAFCAAAVKAAMAGEVDAVVAAPQNETSIAQAGIAFDGHPSFVARQTGTDEAGVYMMLCFGDTRIAHCTLHRSVREAIALITQRECGAHDPRRRRGAASGSASPRRKSRSAASIRTPAKAGCSAARRSRSSSRRWMTVAAEGHARVSGPFGADTMFHMPGFDAFVVMLHDQGHIATKLLAQNAAAALTIGTPILFASVAHGTGHDIAGKGIADPAAMIEAVLLMAKAKHAKPCRLRSAPSPRHARA